MPLLVQLVRVLVLVKERVAVGVVMAQCNNYHEDYGNVVVVGHTIVE